MSIPVSIKEEKPRDNSLFDLSPKMGQWILFTMVRETWIESYEELSPHLYPRPVLASGCPSPAALCPLLLWLKRAGRFPAVWKDEGCRVTKRCLEPWYVYVCVCVLLPGLRGSQHCVHRWEGNRQEGQGSPNGGNSLQVTDIFISLKRQEETN